VWSNWNRRKWQKVQEPGAPTPQGQGSESTEVWIKIADSAKKECLEVNLPFGTRRWELVASHTATQAVFKLMQCESEQSILSDWHNIG
jgi:hypothetical protein